MATRVHAPINPAMLKWARESVGMPLGIAAQKVGLEVDEYRSLEEGQERPTFPKLLKICDVFKRSPGVFFLPTVPPPDAKPTDYRTLDGVPEQPLSSAALLEIRRAIAKRESAIELTALIGEDPPVFRFDAQLGEDTERLGSAWRKKFGAKTGGWKSHYAALSFWKSAVEANNVLVFQPTVESLEDFRGLAFYSQTLPIIMINSRDSVRGRIFSLLHEFCHLLLHVSGIGNMDPPVGRRSKFDDIEVFCNAFAGACLIPKDELKAQSEVRVIASATSGVDALHAVESLVRRYQASWEVVIRRIHDAGLIGQQKYQGFRSDLARHYGKIPPPDGGFAEWLSRRLAANGRFYTNLVLRASAENRISKSEVSSLLGIKINHLPELKVRLQGQGL